MAEEVRFDWDSGNVEHLARHRVSPPEAEQAVLDPDAIMLEIQHEGEDRFKAVGRTAGGRVIAVVFTMRGELVRPITAYDAPIRLQQEYLENSQL